MARTTAVAGATIACRSIIAGPEAIRKRRSKSEPTIKRCGAVGRLRVRFRSRSLLLLLASVTGTTLTSFCAATTPSAAAGITDQRERGEVMPRRRAFEVWTTR